MKQLALLCLMWLGIENHASCEDLTILHPRHISMEYKDYELYSKGLYGRDRVSYRDPYLAPLDEQITYGLGLNIDFDLIKYKDIRLLWDNTWGFDSADTHVRHAYWEFNTGVNYKEMFEAGYQHMSRHVLEDVRSNRFPVKDNLYFKIIIFDTRRK